MPATVVGMNKPKKRGPGRPRKGEEMPVTEEPAKASFQFDDGRLLRALDIYARRTKRSRNKAVNVLLEEAMQREGLWPPADRKGGNR